MEMIDERLHIEELLRRFMQGETTLDEERELGDWLRTHEVDDTLLPYQQMFAAFDAGMPWVQPTPPRRRIVWWHWAAAATVATLLAIGLMLQHMRPTPAMPQPPVTAQAQPDTAVEKTAVKVEILADNRQVNPAVKAKPKAKVQRTRQAHQTRQCGGDAHGRRPGAGRERVYGRAAGAGAGIAGTAPTAHSPAEWLALHLAAL